MKLCYSYRHGLLLSQNEHVQESAHLDLGDHSVYYNYLEPIKPSTTRHVVSRKSIQNFRLTTNHCVNQCSEKKVNWQLHACILALNDIIGMPHLTISSIVSDYIGLATHCHPSCIPTPSFPLRVLLCLIFHLLSTLC